jgi:predicted O-methyltransferase YrrM
MKRSMLLVASLVAAISVLSLGVLAQPPGRGPAGPQAGRGGPFGPMRIPVMTALDADGSGELSAEEIAGAAEALKKLDKDGNGKLSLDELRPQFGDGRGGPGPGPGGPGFGPPGGGGPGSSSGTSMGSEPLGKDDAESKVLQGIKEIQREQGRRMNVPDLDGRLLRLLCESIGAKKVVEFGTSNGISAIWMSLALRKTGGQLISHELDPDTAALARKNFEAVGVSEIVTVVVGDGHETAKKLAGPIDLVFIDADKQGYLDYLEKTLPLVRPGGVICAHNMNPRMADANFLKAITTNPDLETLFYMDGGGMSVSVKKR